MEKQQNDANPQGISMQQMAEDIEENTPKNGQTKRDSSSSASSFTLDSNIVEEGGLGVKVHPMGIGKNANGNVAPNCGCSSSNGDDESGGTGIGSLLDPMWAIEVTQNVCAEFLRQNRRIFGAILLMFLILLYHIFLVFALLHNFHRAKNLAIFTAICWLFLLHKRCILPLLKRRRRQQSRRKEGGAPILAKIWKNVWLNRIFYLLAIILPFLFVFWDCRENPHRLSGLAGFAFFFAFMCICSYKPTKVKWRPVLWGFLLQFFFGLCVLRWETGANAFVELSDIFITFLDFTNNGTDFVYGFLSAPPNICGMEPVFAFKVLQVIIYVGAVVSVLYFYGIIQAVVKRMAYLMQFTMGTTATESLNACGCVFLGNAESPMLIRPYIEKMTASELHAIMTTGFSCIAGSVFATFISFGACPRYLLSGAMMSAPGSLACSKLLYPETEEAIGKSIEELELPPSKEKSAMEAISHGSISAINVVAAVLANLISFVALMALISGILGYAGNLLGHPDWSLEMFFGYLFAPMAYLIGVTDTFEQTLIVGRLLGVKIAVSDFIAYKRLGDVLHLLSPRSAMIATYALCSFSNFIAAGIQMAVLSEMAPSKKQLISKLVLRALLAGCISCFMSAAIAGILVEDPILCQRNSGAKNGNCFDLKAHQAFMEQMHQQFGPLNGTV